MKAVGDFEDFFGPSIRRESLTGTWLDEADSAVLPGMRSVMAGLCTVGGGIVRALARGWKWHIKSFQYTARAGCYWYGAKMSVEEVLRGGVSRFG